MVSPGFSVSSREMILSFVFLLPIMITRPTVTRRSLFDTLTSESELFWAQTVIETQHAQINPHHVTLQAPTFFKIDQSAFGMSELTPKCPQ